MRMTNHAAFGMHPSVEHMLHSPLADSVLKYRRVIIGGALFLLVAVVARPFPVAGRAGLQVEMPLAHVLLLHEVGRVDARGVT